MRHNARMKRASKSRMAVVINREWFGAEEFRPRLKRGFVAELQRLLGRSLALVG